MKKLVLVAILVFVSVVAVSALDFYVTPSANLNLGIGNYFRGASAGGQLFMDFGFLAIGLEVKADYDTAFGNFNVPIMLLLGWRSFWLGAGYTIGVTPMNVTDSSGTVVWAYGGFPNTYAMGFNLARIPAGPGAITIPIELSYTLNGPLNANDPIVQQLGAVAGFFLGLKASVGVGYEIKL